MEMRTLVAEVARKARLPEWRMFALMAAANARPLDVLGNGIGAREWTTLMVTGTLTSFIALLVPTYVVTNSPELALLFAGGVFFLSTPGFEWAASVARDFTVCP